MRSFSLENGLLQCLAPITGTTSDGSGVYPASLEVTCLDSLFFLFISFLVEIPPLLVLKIAHNLHLTQFEVLSGNICGF